MTWLKDSNTHLNKSEHDNSKSDKSALLCADDQQLEEDLNHGLKMVCDRCDHIGSNEYGYPEWQRQEHGGVLCQSCAEDDT